MKRMVVLLLSILLCLPSFSYGIEEAINPDMKDYVEEHLDSTAGLAVGTFNGEGVQTDYFGYMSREPYRKVTDKTVFEWGSVTKVLVWVSILQLEEEGQLKLSDPVNDYLPEFLKLEEGFGKTITILDLMNHRAGFSENLFPPETESQNKIMPLEEALQVYRPQEIYEPDTVTSYSNYGAALAAYVVERISGQNFAQYVHTHIFQPLGMTETAILPDCRDNPLVQDRRRDNQSYIIMEGMDKELGDALSYIELYPAGACTGTLKDFIKFGSSLLPGTEGLEKLFKSKETLEKIYTPTLYFNDTKVPRNAHGLWYLPYGEGVWCHGGNTSGYSSALYLDPKNCKGLVVMCNEVGETYFCYGLANEYFGNYSYRTKTEDQGDISGIYLNARSKYERGYGRLFQYIGGLMPLEKVQSKGLYKVLLADYKVQSIGEGLFIMDNGNGLNSLFAIGDSNNGSPVLEGYTSDFFRANSLSYGIKLCIFFLFVVAVVISIVQLILGLRKFFKKKESFPLFPMAVIVTGLGVYLLLFSETVDSKNLAFIYTLIVIIGTLATLGFSLQALSRGEKRRLNFLTTLILIINVLYWQWFIVGM